MKANNEFINLPSEFWSCVKYISQKIGYTHRKTLRVKSPSIEEIEKAFTEGTLFCPYLPDTGRKNTKYAQLLVQYFNYRATILNDYVEPRLMNAEQARNIYENLVSKFSPKCPIPINKQKGEKRTPAYLTAMVNILIEAHAFPFSCDFEPKELTLFTEKRNLIRTLSRRVDGAFPSIIDPVALWEIKEYYHTTTFGSRVADGIYETLLDGYELKELKLNRNITCSHLLIIDGYYTWWNLGRSYLCRVIDMLHMGFVDDVLFGREVIDEIPNLVNSWKTSLTQKN